MGCGGSKVDTTAQQRTGTGNSKNSNASNTPKRTTQPPANEKGYKRRIRENLRQATEGDDIDCLERNMDIFMRNKLEDGGTYTAAEDRLDFLRTRKDIRDACMRRHPKVLEDAIARVEASPYKGQLKAYLDRAYFLLKNQEDQKTFKHKISSMDQNNISEIRSYTSPPEGVHSTMVATLMLCGEKEEHLLKDWSNVTTIMGRTGRQHVLRRMEEAENQPVDQDVALRARNYLGQHTLPDIRKVSNGAATFYVWSDELTGGGGNKQRQNQNQTPNTGTKPLTNTGGKSSRPGTKPDDNKPKTPSEPSKSTKDPVKDKKIQKEQENKAKQQQTPKDAKQQANQVANTQNNKNAKPTAQQVNSVTNKTRKG